jgi:hypothetical protein
VIKVWIIHQHSHYAFFLKKIYCEETTYSMFKNKLQTVPVTNLKKYLHSDARESEVIINKRKWQQWKILKKKKKKHGEIP